MMLEAQYTMAYQSGSPPGGNADLVFGGGSFEYGRLKKGVTFTAANGTQQSGSISAPVNFTDDELKAIYGENRIGDDPLNQFAP